MKIKKVALLAASALLVAGGVSTVFAMNYTPANKNYSGSTDSAIILGWGTNVVGDVTTLTPTAYVYRSVVVSNPSTAAHTGDITGGDVKLTFTLAEKDGKKLTNVTVGLHLDTTIAAVEALNMSGGKKADPKGKAADITVTTTEAEEVTIPLSTANDYMIVLEFDLSAATEDVIGGSLSIVMDYVPPVEE